MDSEKIKELKEKYLESFNKELINKYGKDLSLFESQGFVLADNPNDILKRRGIFASSQGYSRLYLDEAYDYAGKTYERLFESHGVVLFLKKIKVNPKKIFPCERDFPYGY